jgi:mRNA interferase RelE/StbE
MTRHRYELLVAPAVRRQLAETLSDSVALAAYQFITGPLLEHPHRAGRRLRPPLDDRHHARRGTYRVNYQVDDWHRRVTIVGVFSSADAYRAR